MNQTLSVLHVSTSDSVGGSGRSAWRLHTGLKRLGVRSRLLVGRKFREDPDVQVVSEGWWRWADDICGRVADRLGLQYLFYPSSVALPRRAWVREAGVIQLYNSHGGYLSHTVLPRLSRHVPIVWRLSDMWAMTGHCGYAYDCERWKVGCGACPRLAEYPPLRRDTTALLWKIKRKVYDRSRLTIVAPSKWIADLCQQSPLLSRFPIVVIPNGVDTETFCPKPRGQARRMLDLDPDGPVVLFGANLADPRKGSHLFARAVEHLNGTSRSLVTILVVGSHASRWEVPQSFRVRRLELVRDDALMSMIYAAADIAVLPTVADTLPNSVLESMACGTPNVAFKVGGIPEVVTHMETGYLARPGDPGDLAHGIEDLLSDPVRLQGMRQRCPDRVRSEHSLARETSSYLGLYRSLLGACGGSVAPLETMRPTEPVTAEPQRR